MCFVLAVGCSTDGVPVIVGNFSTLTFRESVLDVFTGPTDLSCVATVVCIGVVVVVIIESCCESEIVGDTFFVLNAPILVSPFICVVAITMLLSSFLLDVFIRSSPPIIGILLLSISFDDDGGVLVLLLVSCICVDP